MSFRHKAIVRFAHVDAAGIVFYPRYFELLNAGVEEWFASMGRDFRALHLHDRIGTPTVDLKCQFISPARLGDALAIILTVEKMGRSSCHYAFRIECEGQMRLEGRAVLVCLDLDTMKSRAWPGDIAAAMQSGVSDRDDGMA